MERLGRLNKLPQMTPVRGRLDLIAQPVASPTCDDEKVFASKHRWENVTTCTCVPGYPLVHSSDPLLKQNRGVPAVAVDAGASRFAPK